MKVFYVTVYRISDLQFVRAKVKKCKNINPHIRELLDFYDMSNHWIEVDEYNV